MSTLESLEQQLVSSRKVREFLKNFSETQWSRVVKASVIMGIQELERSQKVGLLSAKDLEDLVGKFTRTFSLAFSVKRGLNPKRTKIRLPTGPISTRVKESDAAASKSLLSASCHDFPDISPRCADKAGRASAK